MDVTPPVITRMCDFSERYSFSRVWAYEQAKLGNFKIYKAGPRASYVKCAEVEAFLFEEAKKKGIK